MSAMPPPTDLARAAVPTQPESVTAASPTPIRLLSGQSPNPFMNRGRRHLIWGLLFLAPNLIGFLIFTLIPLVMSLGLAFSNWDLRLHNRFKDESIKFVGIDHFVRLVTDENFWRFLGNTLFFMIGLPIGIALSLLAAILLSQDLRGGGRQGWLTLVLGAVLVGSTALLASIGLGGAGLTILLAGLFGVIVVGGTLGGQTVYRTLFYIPNFTAGVATMLLWRKMYNPVNGPINAALSGPLDAIGAAAVRLPQSVFTGGGIVLLLLAVLLTHACMVRLLKLHCDGDVGRRGLLLGGAMLLIPITAGQWLESRTLAVVFAIAIVIALILAWLRTRSRQRFAVKGDEGLGSALMLSAGAVVGVFVLIGLGAAFEGLRDASLAGLRPPNWLQDPSWSKPALMLMGLWGAVGSQTMLLYLAALTNVPGELYEAADIDGASRGQKFWNVTWPQLAPTTFFVVVMGVIGGLQGGFDMARVMTKGGPAGSTTTLAYFIYTEGFETGRLGFSSAVSWTMFLLVIAVTFFNWKFGNRYVND